MTTKSIDRIPVKGFVIANTKNGLVFAPYEIRDKKIWIDGNDYSNLLDADEAHFFDEYTEYRRIHRYSRNDIIEINLTASEEETLDSDLIYKEDLLVIPEYAQKKGYPQKLTTVNRYYYSENDTLVLDNYRIGYNPALVN